MVVALGQLEGSFLYRAWIGALIKDATRRIGLAFVIATVIYK